MIDNEEIKEAHNKVPIGWLIFFTGVIIWTVWYIFTYTPEFSGWSQYKVLEDEMKAITPAVEKITPAAGNPYKNDEGAITEGKGLYASNCAVCHGDNLEGGVGPDLAGTLSYGDTDEKKYESIAQGRPNGMPPFEQQLGRDRIWKILAFMDSKRE